MPLIVDEYGYEDVNVVGIAMNDDVDDLAQYLEIDQDKARQLQADMQEFMRLWIAAMSDDLRERMDERILSRFESDMPRDTALLQLRDLINEHALIGKQGISVDSGYPEAAFIPTNITAMVGPWHEAIELVTQDIAFRLCARCGSPFRYKSLKAMYCSNACRVAASRSKHAKGFRANIQVTHIKANK